MGIEQNLGVRAENNRFLRALSAGRISHFTGEQNLSKPITESLKTDLESSKFSSTVDCHNQSLPALSFGECVMMPTSGALNSVMIGADVRTCTNISGTWRSIYLQSAYASSLFFPPKFSHIRI